MTTYFNVSYSADRLPKNLLDMFFTDSIPIIPSFADPIKAPITFLITIPIPHSNLALNSTLSNSISQPHEQSSDLSKDRFISIPRQLCYSPEEILLPICLTLSDQDRNQNPIPIYISARRSTSRSTLKLNQ